MSGLNDTDETQLTKMLLYWRVKDLGWPGWGSTFCIGVWGDGILALPFCLEISQSHISIQSPIFL